MPVLHATSTQYTQHSIRHGTRHGGHARRNDLTLRQAQVEMANRPPSNQAFHVCPQSNEYVLAALDSLTRHLIAVMDDVSPHEIPPGIP